MKVKTLTEIDFSEHEPTPLLEEMEEYFVVPIVDKNANGNQVHLFPTVVSGDQTTSWIGKKHYEMISGGRLKVRFLEYDEENPKIIKVRILTNPENVVYHYSIRDHEYVRDQDGEIVEYKIKNIPEFKNLDALTDSEFLNKYNKVRSKKDHGLVGHLYDEGNFTPVEEADPVTSRNSSGTDKSTVKQKVPEYDELSKLDQAIAIYKTFKNLPRKEVIKKYQVMLGMTDKGASSYYTKAMHAVEEKNA